MLDTLVSTNSRLNNCINVVRYHKDSSQINRTLILLTGFIAQDNQRNDNLLAKICIYIVEQKLTLNIWKFTDNIASRLYSNRTLLELNGYRNICNGAYFNAITKIRVISLKIENANFRPTVMPIQIGDKVEKTLKYVITLSKYILVRLD